MARKKTWCQLGHSNGFGVAGSKAMLEYAPYLAPNGGAFVTPWTPNSTKNTITIPGRTYPNIMVFTTKVGWPVGAADPSPPRYAIGDGSWLPVTLELPWEPMTPAADQSGYASYTPVPTPNGPHPHASPYNYANLVSIPITPDLMFAGGVGGGSLVGIHLPFSWKLQAYWAEPVYQVHLSVPSTFFGRFDAGLGTHPATPNTLPAFSYGWMSPTVMWDWAPSSGRMYQQWKNKMAGAQAALAPDKMDVQVVMLWMGDNDCTLGSTNPGMIANFEQNYRAFIDRVRQDIVDNDWTSLPKHQIKILLMGICAVYGTAADRATMNAAMQAIEADEPWVRFIDVSSGTLLSAYGYTNAPALFAAGTHFSHVAYLGFAEDCIEAVQDMDESSIDTLHDDQRLTVAQATDKVLLYYQRNRTKSDATDEVVLQHLNGALFHIINKCGDQAWWLRKRISKTLTGDWRTPVTLPKVVQRLLKIEDPNDPTQPLRFEQVGYTDGGRLQILLRERYTGTYYIHYIQQPYELSRDDELIPLPFNMIEWLVVEACRRLSRASANMPLMESFAAEAKQIEADSMRAIATVNRSRIDVLSGSRTLPRRRNLRYYPPWAQG